MRLVNNESTDFVLSVGNLNITHFQVGGAWDKFSTKKEQIKDGLLKLLAILPYDIITLQTWNEIIPHWLQSICEHIDEDEILDLKIIIWLDLLRKLMPGDTFNS